MNRLAFLRLFLCLVHIFCKRESYFLFILSRFRIWTKKAKEITKILMFITKEMSSVLPPLNLVVKELILMIFQDTKTKNAAKVRPCCPKVLFLPFIPYSQSLG